MTRSRWILALLAALGIAACSDSPTAVPPVVTAQPGTVTLRLASPNADDGAIAFEVSGGAIDSVLAGDATLQLFTRRVNDTTLAGAVVGALADGAVIHLHLPDLGAAGRYAARVLEVADRQDEVRASLAGYALNVVP